MNNINENSENAEKINNDECPLKADDTVIVDEKVDEKAVDGQEDSQKDSQVEAVNAKNNDASAEAAEAADASTHYIRTFDSFPETRKYLHGVKECKQRIKLLEKRSEYRSQANLDTDGIKVRIEEAKQKLMVLTADIADEISKLDNVKMEMVMTMRYLDDMGWEQIAQYMDTSIRKVQKLHGRGLPAMEKVLLADGKILMDDGKDDAKADAKAEQQKDDSSVKATHHYFDSHINPEGYLDGYFND